MAEKIKVPAGVYDMVTRCKMCIRDRYMDIEARLDSLKEQRARLQELKASADDLSDLLQIESSLSDVQYQLESYQSQLDWYSRQVECCTVYLSLEEVQTRCV